MQPSGNAADLAHPEAKVVPDRGVSGEIGPIDSGFVIGELQLGKGAHPVHRGAQRIHIDVILDMGFIGRELDLPRFARPVVPGCRAADGVGDLRLEAHVTHVVVAVAKPADHAAGHPIG